MRVADDLARACAQFEALMLQQMLTEAGIGRSAPVAGIGSDNDEVDSEGGIAFGAGAGADLTQSMFVNALAQAVAGADHFGIGQMLESTLRGTTS